MPSVPSYPTCRPTAQHPAAGREYESFDQYESASVTLAASAVFQEVLTFSGTPESIVVDVSAAGVEVRFRNRGEAAFSPILIQGAGERRFQVRAQIVEARDPAAGGGQLVTATGRFASRSIAVRENRPGPSRERPALPAGELAEQVDTSE